MPKSIIGGIGRIIRETTTGADNQTSDIVRIIGGLFAIQFLALAGWSVVALKAAFDPTNYGTGAATLLAALGVAMRVARPVDTPEEPKG